MNRRPPCHAILAAEFTGDGYTAVCWLLQGHRSEHEAPGVFPRLIHWPGPDRNPMPRIHLLGR